MSYSPYFFIEAYNYANGNWEKVDVYTKNAADEFVPVDVWTANGAHALFTILKEEDSYDLPEFEDVHCGLPINASEEMHNIFYSHCCDRETDGFDYIPKVKFFNMADAKLYLQKYLTVEDFDEKEVYWCKHDDMRYEDIPDMYMPNPLSMLIDRVEMILDIRDEWWRIGSSYSDIRIIYWLNR